MSETKDQIINEPTEYTVKQKAREEGRKLQYDFFKHLTTLSTGSILLFITLVEKLFANPKWKLFIAVAFGAFVLSILFSIITMICLAASVLYLGEAFHLKKTIDRILLIGFTCAAGGFVIGVLCLIVFALRNFYR